MPANPGNTFIDPQSTQPGSGACVADRQTILSGTSVRVMQTDPTRLFCDFHVEPTSITSASVGHARLGGGASQVGSGIGYLIPNGGFRVWDGCSGEMWCYAQGGDIVLCMMKEIRR